MDSIGYRDYAAAAFPGRCGILEELTPLSKEFKDIPAWLSFLEKKLAEEEKDLFQKKPGKIPASADSPDGTSVHIVTMHACKGLEYDTVYIPDLNEGTIPARQAWTRDQIEEERRLLYVAVTRAKKALTITYLEGNPDRPAAPSRFLRPLLKSLR
jgi:DNA helicase-2/ATP-dependent DNA helicase PcrA